MFRYLAYELFSFFLDITFFFFFCQRSSITLYKKNSENDIYHWAYTAPSSTRRQVQVCKQTVRIQIAGQEYTSTHRVCLPDCQEANRRSGVHMHTYINTHTLAHMHTRTHTLLPNSNRRSTVHKQTLPTRLPQGNRRSGVHRNTNKPCLPDCQKAIAGQEYT